MRTKTILLLFLANLLAIYSITGHAGWRDWFGGVLDDEKQESTPDESSGSVLTNQTAISGLKQALEKGSQYAIGQLGKEGGFLENADVRIPMPGNLRKVEKTLRSLGASRYADEFVATMNHAAEKAVVEAGPVFVKAIKGMSIDDGLKILQGPDNAATEYFRGKTSDELTTKMLPITRNMTNNAGVTSAYKKMIDKLGFARQLIGEQEVDLDAYVTRKSLDGLYLMIAREEKKIRTNPVARTTDLLKTVFGSK